MTPSLSLKHTRKTYSFSLAKSTAADPFLSRRSLSLYHKHHHRLAILPTFRLRTPTAFRLQPFSRTLNPRPIVVQPFSHGWHFLFLSGKLLKDRRLQDLLPAFRLWPSPNLPSLGLVLGLTFLKFSELFINYF